MKPRAIYLRPSDAWRHVKARLKTKPGEPDYGRLCFLAGYASAMRAFADQVADAESRMSEGLEYALPLQDEPPNDTGNGPSR